MNSSRIFTGLLIILFLWVAQISAQVNLRMQTGYITGLSSPVFLTHAGDGSGRIFIVQQRGVIKVVQRGSRTPTDFLNITSVVSASGSERGLLGLAFHPQYETNRRFFVYYTRQSDGDIQIAEYEANPNNPNLANPNAVRIIITIEHSQFDNHNGGTIAFGPDGYLYAATGDGGSGNDPGNNAQNINSLLGKMLRIDINTPAGQNPAYNIPPTNPFAGATAGADEIFALGLRNPYRFSFDRGMGELWVGDVGQAAIEEVDKITVGGNYGWRVFEGTQCTNLDPQFCSSPQNYIMPVFEYPRVSPRCAVTGGYVYRGSRRAVPSGSYIYADFCSGEILLWHNGQQTILADTNRNISSFGEDERGELYVVGLGGTVDRILGNMPANGDFDGDGSTDQAIYRPSAGMWHIRNQHTGAMFSRHFGIQGDIPAPEDYDGDGKTDVAVYRPSEGTWYFVMSRDFAFSFENFGGSTDVPFPADFDADGKADLATFNPSSFLWTIRRSSTGGVINRVWGVTGDLPLTGDFNADGRTDLVAWRPSTGVWWVLDAETGNIVSSTVYGIDGDVPLSGDFDGDGWTEHTIYRPSTGQWFIRELSGGIPAATWGIAGDIPIVGDFDGDQRDDIAVFRPSTGVWWVIQSSQGVVGLSAWGLASDLPIPKYDTP